MGRNDWRTFRADRIDPKIPTGPRFSPRPAPDVADYVRTGVATATWEYRATVKCFAPAAELASRIHPALTVEPLDERSCVVSVGSDNVSMLAAYVGMLDVDFEVLDAPELVAQLRVLGERCLRAAEVR